jgi:uncharacterized phage-associated protein
MTALAASVGDADPRLDSWYQHWLRYATFCPGITVDAITTKTWDTPLEKLFAGWVYFRANECEAASRYIIAACKASFEADPYDILAGRYIGQVREWCEMEGFSFFSSQDADDLANVPPHECEETLAKVLSTYQPTCPTSPLELTSGHKRISREEAQARIRHATGWFRHELYPILDVKQGRPHALIQALLFYADALHIFEHPGGHSMFGQAPWAYFDGPVYEDGRDLLITLEEANQDASWTVPKEECVLEALHMKVLERVLHSLGNQPTQVLIDLTHTERPWLLAVQRSHRTHETQVEMSLESMETWFTTVPRYHVQ